MKFHPNDIVVINDPSNITQLTGELSTKTFTNSKHQGKLAIVIQDNGRLYNDYIMIKTRISRKEGTFFIKHNQINKIGCL